MRARRSIRAKKSPRVKSTAFAKRSPRAKRSVREKEKPTVVASMVVAETAVASMENAPAARPSGAWALVMVMVFLSAAAMLSASLRSGEVSEGPDASVPAASEVVENVPTRSASVPVATARPEEPAQPKEPSKRLEPARRVEPAATQPVKPTAPEVSIQPAALALGHITPFSIEPAASAAQVSANENVGAVTITGCLEQDDDTFRLKNTSGESAPKGRSWKSGFLRKSSATISVIDTANRLALSSHIGHRVTLTGTLVDREMQARALQRVASSCDQNT
jgi:hypothetical protein